MFDGRAEDFWTPRTVPPPESIVDCPEKSFSEEAKVMLPPDPEANNPKSERD